MDANTHYLAAHEAQESRREHFADLAHDQRSRLVLEQIEKCDANDIHYLADSPEVAAALKEIALLTHEDKLITEWTRDRLVQAACAIGRSIRASADEVYGKDLVSEHARALEEDDGR